MLRALLWAAPITIALAGCASSRRSEGVFLTNAVIYAEQQRQVISEAEARSRVNRGAQPHN